MEPKQSVMSSSDEGPSNKSMWTVYQQPQTDQVLQSLEG